jgi:hypothetical protein
MSNCRSIPVDKKSLRIFQTGNWRSGPSRIVRVLITDRNGVSLICFINTLGREVAALELPSRGEVTKLLLELIASETEN